MAIVRSTARAQATALIPGILLCTGVACVSAVLEAAERHAFGHPFVEALVLAILLGMTIRSFWMPPERWRSGIAFSAKQLLEFAVMLLGASVSFAAIAASGMTLLVAIAAIVSLSLCASFWLCRMLGLSEKLSILIACGNSICGNSAIAAVAPIIRADGNEIASSISFTAVLGVIMVLGLPLFIPLLHLSETQYGILAGLTVYAVPQVLAATVPAGIVSTQIGTLVKLMRVLMLGPIVIGLSLLALRRYGGATHPHGGRVFRLVPWFIVGFLVLGTLRSFGLVPSSLAGPLTVITSLLTIVSMAALGLGVDVRVLANVGGKVTAAVTLSLILLLALSLTLVHLFK
ncbi:YeiH family protein [Bradyrhizobium sp. JYMT SZCCT0428]|uniref:YeiH family protein n=1 Tax=Bradyrhizobium sp. JYMT SZCCT0428 TaxID=2807673 RepID=UPI001BA7B977|nr:YeiH family protein [Bradyrhizobium sp. JYMT SZCCT0428]MBR1149418.1 YeiH family putative sulfate export transporter [Bradyrhizobium sp. JYMT SZCCT0428]